MSQITRRALWTMAAAAVLAVGALTGALAQGMATKLSATLNGTSEVPPVTTAATGKAALTLDKGTKMLTWEISYSGLSGDAKAAHFHGPAAAGANAGVEVPIPVGPSPMKGSATLTDAQMADFLGGKIYINIHTAAHGGGEIRGQVAAGM
jgi:hypothetical protein